MKYRIRNINLDFAQKKFKKNPALNTLLYLISFIYGFIVFIRNKLFDLNFIKSATLPYKTISIGNLTTGGTGKTPLIRYLAEVIKYKNGVGVISRGYFSKGIRYPYLLLLSDIYNQNISDESRLLKKWNPLLSVVLCSSRYKACFYLPKNTEIILLDDAFQHRWVKKDIEILLLSTDDTCNGLIPYGKYRETHFGVKRATILWYIDYEGDAVKKTNTRILLENKFRNYKLPLIYSSLVLDKLESLDSKISYSINDIKKYNIYLFTSIAEGHRFASFITSFGINIVGSYNLRDHADISSFDLAVIEKKAIESKAEYILITEKDAIKIIDLETKAKIIVVKTVIKIDSGENVLRKILSEKGIII